jgi:predicted P-loop ATPase
MHSLPDSPRPSTAKSVTESQESNELSALTADWTSLLIMTGDGDRRRPAPLLNNAEIALTHAPEWQGVLGYDTTCKRNALRRLPPWTESRSLPIMCTGLEEIRVASWLQRQGIYVGREIAKQAIESVAFDNPFNPIADYIDTLTWDEEDARLPTWASRYLGCPQNLYIETVTTYWLISMIARGYHPGTKVDTCVILEGDQGSSKSEALRVLGGQFFTDDIGKFDTDHVALQLMGKWLIELPEIDKLKSTRVDLAKVFLPRMADNYTAKWIGYAADYPRSCVFAGTVNPTGNGYFKDETGNRRYWPFPIGKIDLKALARDRDQLLAEAKWMYLDGRPWWVPKSERVITRMIEQEQRLRFQHHPWEEDIEKFAQNRLTVTISEIMTHLDIPPKGKNEKDRIIIGQCLESLGWRIFRPQSSDDTDSRPRVYKRKQG